MSYHTLTSIYVGENFDAEVEALEGREDRVAGKAIIRTPGSGSTVFICVDSAEEARRLSVVFDSLRRRIRQAKHQRELVREATL